jgi:hypothetical protein
MNCLRLILLGTTVVALEVMLSACGGSDKEGSDTATTEAPTAPETVIAEEDQELAEASLLRLSDFPTGWRASESDDDEDDATALEECFKPDFEGVTVTGRAESDDFKSGTNTEASSVAAVYSTPAGTEKVFSQFTDGTLADCMVSYLKEQSPPEGTKITNVEAGQLSFPPVGEASDARQIVVEVESEGLTPSIYLDLVGIREGRAFSLLLFLDVLSPFSPDEEVELARKVAHRMTAGG